ncbi:MAG TPA: tRNA (adenosine(37)-N6)-threonylcarbamoyltransferase complex dimerization subunit type 1 TsaB [Polyangiaceae bacterium]|nr:tRNA (adenosine(37)-N6)-threonylcarbamoyltransferase complex dimerization subunit type 1 TsaB [Polyangiaceae bacterium]
MRVLGIETSSRRGTVAVLAEGRVLAVKESTEPHGDRLLGLVGETLREAGLEKTDLDRLGVGIGPGSFTGVRVGVALAQGIALGLGRPLVGVSSLRAMCRAVPGETPGARCAVLDARRGELFFAAYAADGRELVAPRTIAPAELAAAIRGVPGAALLVGEPPPGLPLSLPRWASLESDLPHAVAVARAASELSEIDCPPEPAYVREADAIRPDLPKSPLSSGGPR